MAGLGTTVEERRHMTVVALSGAVDVYTAAAVEETLDDVDPAERQGSSTSRA
jgi:hypothetical protein